MHELYFLVRTFVWGNLYRFFSSLIVTFLGVFMFGMVLANTVPDWMKSLAWLRNFATALRALPPWDFILVMFAITLLVGYGQRITTYLFRRRNMTTLGKIATKEHKDGADGKTIRDRRQHMMGRSKLTSMMFRLSAALGTDAAAILALLFFGYWPSAIILTVLTAVALLFLPWAVRRWERGFIANRDSQTRLKEELQNSGHDSELAEITVHTERMKIRAKLPVLRLQVTGPILAIIFPGTILAAAIESWVFAANGTSSVFNKLLIILMGLSLRSMLHLTTVVETLSNRIARVTMPDPMDDEDDDQ